MKYSNTYAKIDLDAILHNYRAIRQHAGISVMAVVKADAYGHGAVPVARLLENECDFFGVSSVAEALELRNAGITLPILLLGHTPVDCYPEVVEHNLRVAMFDPEEAKQLSLEAQKQNKTAYIHFKVDTGMSRIGLQPDEAAADLCAEIARLPGLYAEGLFSHFATADELELEKTEQQAAKFAAFDEMLKARMIDIPIRHLDNSAGALRRVCQYEMVRAGIALYGVYPFTQIQLDMPVLHPAMSWYSKVSYIKTLEAGKEISYGGTYTTTGPTVVATIPAGYADGYRRSLSNRFYVLIRGKKAPILGRVCMDQFMVDVTENPDVQPGDEVVLMGRSGDKMISVERLSAMADSFPYEQLCDVSRRVSRVYIQDGKEIETVNYLLERS